MYRSKGLSEKEIDIVSYLELNEKFFFSRKDIRKFFKNKNEMNVYIHRLKKKGRIIKLNKSKYYLIPVKAFKGKWSEHPFVLVDEIFNGRDYFIAELAAANFWGLVEQIPTKVVVYCTRKQGQRKIFGFTIVFKRKRRLKNFVKQRVGRHEFLIQSKESVKKWLKEYLKID